MKETLRKWSESLIAWFDEYNKARAATVAARAGQYSLARAIAEQQTNKK